VFVGKSGLRTSLCETRKTVLIQRPRKSRIYWESHQWWW